MANIEIFKRTEQKYVLSFDDYNKLLSRIENNIEKDAYFESKISNLYFDNDNYDLIVNSLEKDIYKKKVRLRCYDTPRLDDDVFLEIKSKLKGVVYKRRVTLKLKDYYKYLNDEVFDVSNKQIMKEIDYFIKRFNLEPKYLISYDRNSYYDKNNKEFRITFDKNIRSRREDLKLELGNSGRLYFDNREVIMELKSNGGIPLWFSDILNELKIYPGSFSKYGSIYQKDFKGGN